MTHDEFVEFVRLYTDGAINATKYSKLPLSLIMDFTILACVPCGSETFYGDSQNDCCVGSEQYIATSSQTDEEALYILKVCSIVENDIHRLVPNLDMGSLTNVPTNTPTLGPTQGLGNILSDKPSSPSLKDLPSAEPSPWPSSSKSPTLQPSTKPSKLPTEVPRTSVLVSPLAERTYSMNPSNFPNTSSASSIPSSTTSVSLFPSNIRSSMPSNESSILPSESASLAQSTSFNNTFQTTNYSHSPSPAMTTSEFYFPTSNPSSNPSSVTAPSVSNSQNSTSQRVGPSKSSGKIEPQFKIGKLLAFSHKY